METSQNEQAVTDPSSLANQLAGLKLSPTKEIDSQVALLVHAEVDHAPGQGLGIGLILRVACARTGQNKTGIMGKKQQSFTINHKEFAAPSNHPHRRANIIAILRALQLARTTILESWTSPPATVVVLLGQRCEKAVETVLHHLENEPESPQHEDPPSRSTMRNILQEIYTIRGLGFKVKLPMSGIFSSDVYSHPYGKKSQLKAARLAGKKFRRACRNATKKQWKDMASAEEDATKLAEALGGLSFTRERAVTADRHGRKQRRRERKAAEAKEAAEKQLRSLVSTGEPLSCTLPC